MCRRVFRGRFAWGLLVPVLVFGSLAYVFCEVIIVRENCSPSLRAVRQQVPYLQLFHAALALIYSVRLHLARPYTKTFAIATAVLVKKCMVYEVVGVSHPSPSGLRSPVPLRSSPT